jgi:hypothetical protein
MFKNVVPLNPDKHAKLRFEPLQDYQFSKNETLVPIVFSEAWPIAREYVMLFPKEPGGVPLALLGMETGVNAYVDIEPKWWGRYIPAHIRRYPFIAAAHNTEGQKNGESRSYTVMIETEASQLGYEKGEYLFDEKNQPTDLLKNIRNVLGALQKDLEFTAQLVAQIEKADLLVQQHIRINRPEAEPFAISGFRVVDDKRLKECSGETLKALAQTRALELIYAHIGSLTNLRDGLLAKKAKGEIKAPKETLDLESLFKDRDDMFRFDA